MSIKLIADSGSTKTNWCLLAGDKPKMMTTKGLSPYFLSPEQMGQLLKKSLLPKIKDLPIDEIHFYGTGLADTVNRKKLSRLLLGIFPNAKININTDMLGAAHATCGNQKGMVSILGTGSGCAYYSGKKIAKVQNGLGYILGDEGSGAYLGKKVIQHFLYKTFDDDLVNRFEKKYQTTRTEILDHVYHQDTPNRYLASYARFLSENRGHYMIENIIEDGLNEFIYTSLYKFREAWTQPIHFVGGVAAAFQDVLKTLAHNYELELGTILKKPIDGLAAYYQKN